LKERLVGLKLDKKIDDSLKTTHYARFALNLNRAMTRSTIPNKIAMVPIPEPRIGAPGIDIIAAPTITKIIPIKLRIIACMLRLFAVCVFSTILNSPLFQ
jgi:hypothetical protein